MVEAFKEAGVPLWVAYYRRALPRFLTVRDCLGKGEIGRVTSVHVQVTAPLLTGTEAGWRVDPEASGGGLFFDLASHCFDLLDFLVGEITAVSGLAVNTGGTYAAEDVTAAAFERAFRKQRTYKPDRGSARGWLFGIARNAALDELRRRSRTAELPAEVPAPAEDLAERAVLRTAVAAALAALPPRDREVVALKFHAGLDNAEIAAVLGVSATNAGTLLHRAMTKLREAIDAD